MLPAIMNDAVTVSGGQAVTTSLKIADVFDKEHKTVIRAIERLELPESMRQRYYVPTVRERPNPSNGKPISSKMYLITRDGMILLTMGFTGAKAMQFKIAYLEAFNAMEAALKRGDIITDEAALNSEHPIFDAVLRKSGITPDGSDKAQYHRYKGVEVISTTDLADICGIKKERCRNIVRKMNLIDGVDIFRLACMDSRTRFMLVNSGVMPSARANYINLFTRSGYEKVYQYAKLTNRLNSKPAEVPRPIVAPTIVPESDIVLKMARGLYDKAVERAQSRKSEVIPAMRRVIRNLYQNLNDAQCDELIRDFTGSTMTEAMVNAEITRMNSSVSFLAAATREG